MNAKEYWTTALRLTFRNMLFMGVLMLTAIGLSEAAGASFAVPEVAAIGVGAVAANLTRRPAREAVLRRVARRPRMTPEDYRHLREMEIELGFEPSEPPASVWVPVQPARWQPPRQPARHKYLYGSVWSTSGVRASCRVCEESKERAEHHEATIAEMTRGQARYTVPWAMRADLGGGLWLHPRYTVHDRPGGTVQMRIELRGDGYHVWPVAGEAPRPGGGAGIGYLPVAVLEGKR